MRSGLAPPVSYRKPFLTAPISEEKNELDIKNKNLKNIYFILS